MRENERENKNEIFFFFRLAGQPKPKGLMSSIRSADVKLKPVQSSDTGSGLTTLWRLYLFDICVYNNDNNDNDNDNSNSNTQRQ